jgi:hypothetical protein
VLSKMGRDVNNIGHFRRSVPDPMCWPINKRQKKKHYGLVRADISPSILKKNVHARSVLLFFGIGRKCSVLTILVLVFTYR